MMSFLPVPFARQTALLIQIHINMHWRVNFISYLGEDLPQKHSFFWALLKLLPPTPFGQFFFINYQDIYCSFWGTFSVNKCPIHFGPPKCALPKRTTCFFAKVVHNRHDKIEITRQCMLMGILISKMVWLYCEIHRIIMSVSDSRVIDKEYDT